MDNIKALKAEIVRLEFGVVALQEVAEDYRAKCIICHKIVADKNQEIIELKKEREILQSTIRSFKSRG